MHLRLIGRGHHRGHLHALAAASAVMRSALRSLTRQGSQRREQQQKQAQGKGRELAQQTHLVRLYPENEDGRASVRKEFCNGLPACRVINRLSARHAYLAKQPSPRLK